VTTLALLIPAYNAATYLPRLLASAQRQTRPFDEIWVYDDCSTDDTAAVAEAWGARVVRGAHNVGCSAGKNAVARRAGTRWVHFHDADDELRPDFVEKAQAWMERPVDVVLFAYEERDDSTGQVLGVRQFSHDQLVRDPRFFAITEQINPFCGLYRLDACLRAGGYNEDPRVLYNEDVAFHIRLAFAGLRFAADPAVTVVNYRRAGSMSAANAHRCLLAQMAVLEDTLALPGGASYRAAIGAKLWHLAGLFAAEGDWRHADAAVTAAWRQNRLAPGSRPFQVVGRVAPRLALRLREAAIRLLRPHLRTRGTSPV
jgi:glycosyltransferase involved in cell wall biosynthesis